MTEWKDISTAPRDATIIVYVPGTYRGGIHFARWSDEKYHSKPTPHWDWKSIFGVRDTRAKQPTKWQPLPKPPESE